MTTSTNMPQFSCGEMTVTRRYSDFDWLANQLAIEFPGLVIPALPDKQKGLSVFASQSNIIESRTRGLEKFLQRIADHPQMIQSPRFLKFLQADDAGFQQLRDGSQESKLPSMSWLGSLASSGGKVV